MNSKTMAFVLALLAIAGCTLNKSEVRRDNLLTRIGGGGQVIEPKRCALQVAILSRPLRDEALNAGVWDVADEQEVGSEMRRALEANGLRIGMLTGTLPAEIETILNAPPPNKVDPSQVLLPDGDHTLISLSESVPVASLLLNRENRTYGKDYDDASGWFRVTARQEGLTAVALRLVPEIHFGPIQHAFGAMPNSGAYAPQRFMLKDGQEEETLRDLATTLYLQPGQVVVVGCRPEKGRSLGTFLFTQPEVNSDRLLQKLLLIWASRTSQGLPTLEAVDPPDMPQSSRQKAADKEKEKEKEKDGKPTKLMGDPPA